jgi:hypothetical protein
VIGELTVLLFGDLIDFQLATHGEDIFALLLSLNSGIFGAGRDTPGVKAMGVGSRETQFVKDLAVECGGGV